MGAAWAERQAIRILFLILSHTQTKAYSQPTENSNLQLEKAIIHLKQIPMTLYYFTSEVAFPSLKLFRSDQKVEKVALGGVGKPLWKPNRIDKAEKNERITTRDSAKVPIMGVSGTKGNRPKKPYYLCCGLSSRVWVESNQLFLFSTRVFGSSSSSSSSSLWVEVGMENGWKGSPSQVVSLQGVWFQRTKVHPTLLIRPGRPRATHDQLAGRTQLFNVFIHSIILSSRFGSPPQECWVRSTH